MYTIRIVKRNRSFEDDRVRDWVTSKRGILTRIAVSCACSPQFVQQVAYGYSTALPGNDVELALKRNGWPGHRQQPKPEKRKDIL